MGRLFGTDGVRGVANVELTPEMAFSLGRVGSALMGDGALRPCFVVGCDPRISGPLLETALTSGMLSTGADVYRVGVMTTPGVALLIKRLGATGGVVVSASHNPFEYNGIKFFNERGEKISESLENSIEEGILSGVDNYSRPQSSGLGRIIEVEDAVEQYINFLQGTVHTSLEGMKLVVDCANGAASRISPQVFERLGAEVIGLNVSPDGLNINVECGSLHPETLAKAVVSNGADAGVAHDGDADRVIAVDDEGAVIDGDFIMAVIGLDMLRKGLLPSNTVVATVMSNMGLDLVFKEAGGQVVKTQVGDRCVLEEMKSRGLVLGGEQSGHIIFLDHLPTGDGILTAVQLLQVVKASEMPLSRLTEGIIKAPQETVNVPVKDKGSVLANPSVVNAISEAERILGDRGRVLVRPSGTEPVVRVMVEGLDQGVVRDTVARLVEVIENETN